MDSRVVYTIGHSNYPLDHFLALLKKHGIEVLIDIRSQPYSRYVPHFNRESLQKILPQSGLHYLSMGEHLGGRPKDPQFYNSEGKVDYTRIAASAAFQEALSRLLEEAKEYRAAIMCSEENPALCHRRFLVGRALLKRGVILRHIRGDGRVEEETRQELLL